MKKFFSSIFIFLAAMALFAASSEASIYDEVCSAFNSAFYPGVVEKSAVFEKQFPDSVYILNVKLMKGEALLNMYRYEESIEVLESIEKKLPEDSEDFAKSNYFIGLANYYLFENTKALRNFYKTCTVLKEKQNNPYFSSAVLFSGRIYYLLNDFQNVIQPFEFVVSNGNLFSKADYDEVIQKLLNSYNNNRNYPKTIELFNQLKKEDFTDEVYFTLALYSAIAYEQLGGFRNAYDLYSSVVESGLENLAVAAMKSAYLIATEQHIANPADIFTKSAENFKNSPELVNDFWIRLGIDEFNNSDYEKSKEYFGNVNPETPAHILLTKLYQAKLQLAAENNPESAELLLNELLNSSTENLESYNFKDSILSSLLKAKLLLGKNEEIPDLYACMTNPDESSQYICAAGFYNQGNYNSVISFAEETYGISEKNITKENLNIFELYASALAKCKKNNTACKIYRKIDESGYLSSKTRFEYAKTLFISKDFLKAYTYAQKSEEAKKEYLSGLCMNNLKKYDEALTHFIAYIKAQGNTKDFILLAYFYKGYSEYRLSDWKNSYASFVRYASDEKEKTKTYVRKAYEYSAKAALQTGDFKNAAIQAENLVKNSTAEKDKQNAIMFCVEIYSNIENYNKAIELLKPFTNERNDFAMECLYQTAKIYSKLNDVKKAEEIYDSLIRDYPGTVLAEESAYNVGELYYSHNDYQTAEKRFNNYVYKYPKGKLFDSALFFCADCNLRLGNLNKSILLNKTLVSEYSKSIYLYGAYKNLYTAYYSSEDYSNALETARTIVAKYPTQAVSDEIGRKVVELERIVGGTDKRVSEKLGEYERLGKASTKAGRIAGSELVKYYGADVSLQEETYRLAKELLESQVDEDEAYYAAQNAEVVADYERRKQNNEQAAQMYLKAAKLYRKTVDSKDSEVASVLYSAVEAFKAADLIADAKETADLLTSIYPDSNYAKRVHDLVR